MAHMMMSVQSLFTKLRLVSMKNVSVVLVYLVCYDGKTFIMVRNTFKQDDDRHF